MYTIGIANHWHDTMTLVTDTVNKCKLFFGIDCALESIPYNQYKKTIQKTDRGVYILESENGEIIYVGKGNIKARQNSHWPKAHGDLKSYTVDPKGWKWLRENFNITPGNWTLYYINLTKETELSAMEGALIHFLQPLANDETFKDEQRILCCEKTTA